MRVLVVGFSESIHTVRALELIQGLGWSVHLFPSAERSRPHADLRDVTVYVDPSVDMQPLHPSVRVEPLRSPDLLEPLGWRDRARLLAELIDELRPDLLHSHELQHGAYLTFDARGLTKGPSPPWLVSNWGSDIYWFGRHPRHVERLKAVMSTCDVYACECHRDVGLARAFGFRGPVLPVLPVTGGFDLDRLRPLRLPGDTSARRTIALKGYLGWVGRADVAVRALDDCGDMLEGYRLALYLVAPEVLASAERLCSRYGLELDVLSRQRSDERPHEDLLAMHGRSRISIGLTTSDGISTSFLEALAMGSFPVQSNTGCAGDWALRGVSALFVRPDDQEELTAALRRALTDDKLIDQGVARNDRTVAVHLDRRVIAARLMDAYERIVASRPVSPPVGEPA